jgi:hypothetical protein
MRLKVLGVTLILVLLAVSAHATTVIRGSVGGGGAKGYLFVPNGNGHVQITLMYDNVGSDLDLAVGFTDNNGDAVLVGSGTSTLKQFERCEAGVDPNIIYTVVVNSYRGASAFRLYVTTTSEELVGIASTPVPLQEIDINHASEKLLNELGRIQHAQHKK